MRYTMDTVSTINIYDVEIHRQTRGQVAPGEQYKNTAHVGTKGSGLEWELRYTAVTYEVPIQNVPITKHPITKRSITQRPNH